MKLTLETIEIRLGKVRRHRWSGLNLSRCEKCGEQFSDVIHK